MVSAAICGLPGVRVRRALDWPLLWPYQRWAEDVLKPDYQPQNRQKVVGYLDKTVLDGLEQRGMAPRNLAITLTDKELRHIYRDKKRRRGTSVPKAELLNLSRHIERPQAVLFDKIDPALLYVFDAGEKDRLGKIVIRVNYEKKLKYTNNIRTGGMVSLVNLRDTNQLELIKGKL